MKFKNNLLSSLKEKTASVLAKKESIVDGDEFDNLVFNSDDE